MLGISFFKYIRVGAARRRHRISQIGDIPSLDSILGEKSYSHAFGWSWIPE